MDRENNIGFWIKAYGANHTPFVEFAGWNGGSWKKEMSVKTGYITN